MRRASFHVQVLAGELIIHAGGAQPVTIAALPRYFNIELENPLRQFIGPEPSATIPALPKASDYKTISARTEVLRLPVARAPDGKITIGELTFSNTAENPRARVTYKATDRVMPNLPRDKQSTFFPGPGDATSEPIFQK